jgi:oxygen-independent coproporphyrinogen-3 oxidase
MDMKLNREITTEALALDSVIDRGGAGGGAPLGLYVHVPFCASTCDFCAFYQTTPSAEGVQAYLQTIDAELALVKRPRQVGTVFWGGGTPGLLSPKDLRRLGDSVLQWCGEAPAEWTVEMAPASVTDARLAALKDIGVTRISMGAQSFQPELLDALGRQHTLPQVLRAYERIRAADFASVNIDLMFALPGQDETAWMADMDAGLALAPDHLSTYCLTFEEDTKLWVKLSEGKVKLDTEREAQLYERTWERLGAAGYFQYEVANFAKPGHPCRHNLNTWHMHEWVGVGPSAASQFEGWRAANPSDLELWQSEVAAGERATVDRVALTPDLLAEDALIFGLRLNEGVSPTALACRWPNAPWAQANKALNDLVSDGLAERRGDRVKLTVQGRLLADAVGASVMEAMG